MKTGRHLTALLLFAFALLTVTAPTATAAQTLTDLTVGNIEFRTIGPVTMSGRFVDIAVVDNNPYTFYVASSTGGVWKTTNNGVVFIPVFERESTHSVGAITVHQVDTNVVWVGTGERASRQSSSWGDGVYKSTDGGDTWTNMGLHDSHHIGRIVLHPTNPNIVYVAAMGHLWGPNEERGLYMSEDGGLNWTRVLEGDEDTGVVDVAIDRSDPNVMYAAKYQRRRRPYGFHGGGPGSGLYKSTNGGRNWTELTNDLPEGDMGRIGISIYRSDPNIVYVSIEQGWRYNASTAYGERRAGIYRSEDKGETWEHMSDWNPRPMYASQPLVDPNDDQRIYMVNAYSYSDDGGRTFTRPPQTLHGDDRLVWVDPNDSRHVIKADDGSLGISYDRGLTWLMMTHLPVSQFYHVNVDMRKPYWVYGGLQDNGSWMGPSATYRAGGILFDDWLKTGGGDGFLNLVDTTDNKTLYNESQYLGLTRIDLASGARTSIRPDNERGAIGARRNWDAWGPGLPEPELGNAMAPANWDGPFLISVHDNNTLYAGTNQIWKSTDRGDTWTSLGDLTTGVNRRELTIMEQRPHDSTLSLDDGIPYYPTLTAIAESPLVPGLLYAGTDDGNLQESENDGQSWTNVTGRVPGMPSSTWLSNIEPSGYDANTVFFTTNNYRNNDFANYVYKSTDRGQTWTSISGNLPANRVARTIREDLRNPSSLYLGTELGLFFSNDGGTHWVELKGNMPTMAFNDLVIHPRDNDLVLGTHSRGIWILDNINMLQELTPDVVASEAFLFTMERAEMIRYNDDGGHTGDMYFRGENPPEGATIDYYLSDSQTSNDMTITILDVSGSEISRVQPELNAGLNRVIWDLHYESIAPERQTEYGRRGTPGPWVLPGEYTVRLSVGGRHYDQQLEVREDPRITVSDAVRGDWHNAVLGLAGTVRSFLTMADSVMGVRRQLDELPACDEARNTNLIATLEEIEPLLMELRSRLTELYGEVSVWPAPFTADQQAQQSYFEDWIRRLEPQVRSVIGAQIEGCL